MGGKGAGYFEVARRPERENALVTRPGLLWAGSDAFDVRFSGPGGHGGMMGRRSSTHPFLQGKAVLSNNSEFVLMGGVRF